MEREVKKSLDRQNSQYLSTPREREEQRERKIKKMGKDYDVSSPREREAKREERIRRMTR
jgi:hypothetical protein